MSAILKLSSPATREYWEIPILWEDEHLLAINKPPCLLVSPDHCDPNRPSLRTLLHAAIAQGKPWAKERGLTYLMNAHRLDFETSGVLLLAKSKPMVIALANLFGAERPVRSYIALVEGTPEQDRFEVDAPIGMHSMKPGLMRIDRKEGKKSRTLFEVMEKFDGSTVLRCQPVTGRTHQLRVHLQSVGLPIAGDATYGGHQLFLSRLKPDYRLRSDREERPLIGTLALHAERLELNHPVTGQPVSLTAEWPKDLKVAVKYLRRYATPGTWSRA